MKVLVTGGAGYVGSRLVPALLSHGHQVVVYDMCYYGCYLPAAWKYNLFKADIRDTGHLAAALKGCDAVLHLACISNDPSVELDKELSKSINLDAFEPLVKLAKDAGVKRFVYCSSSSVYGQSDAPEIREDHALVPLTAYNTYKAACEPILFSHQADDFICTTIRPSTICGYSPRMRLDLAVNIFTNHAVNKGMITVLGGKQLRPNLHIEDMVDCYLMLLAIPKEKIAGETFNVGQRNYSIRQLADLVKLVVDEEYEDRKPVVIEQVEGELKDTRSYQVNSDKIAQLLGFKPTRTVEDAVRGMCKAFARGLIPNPLDDDRYYNVKTLKKTYNSGVLSEIDLLRGAKRAPTTV